MHTKEESKGHNTIWIDADGCPKGVIRSVDLVTRQYGWQSVIVATYDHHVDHPNRITVDAGDQSTDLYITNRIKKGDIVVTQDIGLAALCMARGAIGIHVSGHIYTSEEMTQVLEFRAFAAKARRAGMHTKGPKKRTKQDDEAFYESLSNLLKELAL